jgi:medium-chain acyl-[acyl-carrier-protein] hydrolase
VTGQQDAVWSETFRVRAYEVDASGRASVPALCNWLQEAAGNHATALGWGVDALQERGLTWVLARFHLRLARQPGWRQDVRVRTWPAGVQRLYAVREFRISSVEGGELGLATTAWLLVGLSNLRPVRLPTALEEMARDTPGRVLNDPFAKLPELNGPEFEAAVGVGLADLDMNRHANNVSLIAAALEPLPDDVVLGGGLTELEMEFRAEVLRGDRLQAHARREGGEGMRFVHRLVRERDGREVARARTAWAAPGTG